MRRQGRAVRSQTYHILGSDCSIFQNVVVRDPRHNSDQFIAVGSLPGASPREHYNYLGIRIRLPLHPPGLQMRTRADELFSELRRAVPKWDKRAARHKSWISAETWRLVNKRVSMVREPGRDQQRLRRLGRAIRVYLKADRQQWVTTSGEEVESLLTRDPPLPREDWMRMWGWYQEAVDHAPPPARVTLERITAESKKL